MAPKIFITGATGYIGGQALDAIVNAHPEYEISALCRTEQSAHLIKKKYPNVRTVLGDLDSLDTLKSETTNADIIINTANADHLPSAQAITKALSSSSKQKFLIHTSGSAILHDLFRPDTLGRPISHDKLYNDVGNIKELTSFPEDNHPHRIVDAAVISSVGEKVHIAIVCPPCIYGTGTGPGNTRSAQIPLLIKSVLKRGTGFTVHAGENEWCNVHIKDLGRVYLRLVEAAARGGEGADWDQDGYYFVDAGNMTWGGLTRELVDKCVEKGLLKSTEIQNLEPEEVDKIQPFGSILWGSNSRGHGERARKVLGWKPEEVAVEETLGESVEIEAKDLGML